jgi:hypothetical protein
MCEIREASEVGALALQVFTVYYKCEFSINAGGM